MERDPMPDSCLSIPRLFRSRVAVLGFGRSGQSATDFLLAHGCIPRVYAQGGVPEDAKAKYLRNGVSFYDDFPETFEESVLVRSPVIHPDILPIRRALARGAMLTGEADLFLAGTAATVIGVTGSDGKTTTANMIAALLRTAGKRAVLGGNNGMPLLAHVDTLTSDDFAVVELSSFQLMTAPSPHVAVITNITPNHLNWHTDFFEYAAAKCRIYTAGAVRLVTNADCPATREIGSRAALPVTWFSLCGSPDGDSIRVSGDDLIIKSEKDAETVSVFRDFSLLGAHNRANFAAAVAAVLPFVDRTAIPTCAREFRGVRHRLEHVATVDGVTYINSSIDTSPTRTAAALLALSCRPLVIVGGRGKGIDLAPLADSLVAHARAVFLYGETASEIAAHLGARVPHMLCGRFADAFEAAVKDAGRGDTVLLSPGCTAFGEFRDFEERGDAFCHLVKKLAQERKG